MIQCRREQPAFSARLGYDLICADKHDERKRPKNLGHIESLARSYTDTAIKTLAGIMMEQTSPPMARIVAAKVLLDRGWGKPKEMHHSEVDDNKTRAIGRVPTVFGKLQLIGGVRFACRRRHC